MDAHKDHFLRKSILRAIISMVLIVGVFLGIRMLNLTQYLVWLEPLTSKPLLMYTIFLISETVIGIIPPEFYMMWSLDERAWIYIQKIVLLTLISVMGALIAYWSGRRLNNTQLLRKLLRRAHTRTYVARFQQYGGWLIVLSAVTPLPFALISAIAGSLGYRFSRYLTFASFRLVRFGVYSWIIWQAHVWV